MNEVLTEKNKAFGKDLKIIIVGNLSTGKTSIINRYIHHTFDNYCKATIAPEFSFKVVKYNGINFRAQFWDLPGQDPNPIVTSIFCRDTDGIIFCCEVNNEKSRNDILLWINSLQGNIDTGKIPKILVENKCDLLQNEDNYNDNFEELKKFSDENNFSRCFRVSALNGYNIDKSINFLINEIARGFDENDIKTYEDSVILDATKTYKSDNKKCC